MLLWKSLITKDIKRIELGSNKLHRAKLLLKAK